MHTQEPWRVREHPSHPDEFHVSAPTPVGNPYHGRTKEIEILSDELYPTKRADAERIVACVNACAGIATPRLVLMLARVALIRFKNGGSFDPEAQSALDRLLEGYPE